MADLPEYKNRTKIEPSPVAEATPALSNLSKSWEAIGQMGAQVAQNQANEISRISGAELGRNKPGLELFPAIGESGAEFLKAYKTQEYSTALNKGMKALDGLVFSSLAFPSEKALDNYDKFYQKYLDDITSQLTKENQIAVREQLQAAFLSGRYKISSQLLDQAARAEKDQFKQTFELFGRRIMDAVAQNNNTEADITYREAEEFIRNPENVYDLSPAARDALVKSLGDIYKDSKIRNEALTAIKNKKGEELVAKYAKLPATVENMRKAEVAAETLKMYATQTSAHDQLLIAQATTKMQQQGGLSTADLAYLKQEVTPGRFADFEAQHTRFMNSERTKANAADYMDTYAGNAAMLKLLGSDGLDKGFKVQIDREQEKLGRPLSFAEKATVAQKFDAAIPSINKEMIGGINSRNPAIAKEYANIFGIMSRNNPNWVEGVDNATAVKAEALNDAFRYAASPEDAWNEANKGFNHLTPKEVNDSIAAFQEKFNDTYGRGADTQFNNVLKSFDYSALARRNNPPPGLAIDFKKLAEANYVQSRDWNKSIEVARQKISNRYLETEHNGFKQIQLLPPTKFLPLEDIRRIEVDYLKQLTAQQNEMVNNPEILVPFQYELDKDFIISGVGITSIVPGIEREATNPYRGVRRGINYKGEKIEEKGQFIIVSDKFTDYVTPDQPLPSWSVMFLPDNKLSPDLVYAPQFNEKNKVSGIQNARFMIPPQEIAAKNAVDKDLIRQKEAINNIIRKMAAQIGQQP